MTITMRSFINSVQFAAIFLKGFFNAKMGKRLSRQQLENKQIALFHRFEKTVLNLSPFYQKYAQNSPTPNKDIFSLLKHYPIINKAIHIENFDLINTAQLDKNGALQTAINSEKSRDFTPLYKGFSVGLSSGTSGNRGLFVTSDQERAEWAGYIIGKLLPLSYQRQRVAFFLRANNNLYERANGLLLQFRFFDLLDGIDAHVAKLAEFNPSILIAPASVLTKIAQIIPTLKPRKIISVAEVLEPEEKRFLEQHFQQTIHQVYQCTEGFLAATCNEGHLHLNEDSLIIEKHWLDKESGRFSPVITDLKRKTQPVVRYLLDDILILDNTPCPCGSSQTRLKSIEGRKDDVLRFKTLQNEPIDVFPDFIRNTLIMTSAELKEYQVIQVGQKQLCINLLPRSAHIEKQITDALNDLFQRLDIPKPNYQFDVFTGWPLDQKRRRVLRKINDKHFD